MYTHRKIRGDNYFWLVYTPRSEFTPIFDSYINSHLNHHYFHATLTLNVYNNFACIIAMYNRILCNSMHLCGNSTRIKVYFEWKSLQNSTNAYSLDYTPKRSRSKILQI